MAIQNQQAGVMAGPYVPRRGQPGAADVHADAVAAVNALAYGELWRQPANNPLTDTPNVRMDLQGYTAAGQMNLQLQVNGVRGVPSTVAAILVANTVMAVPPPSPRSVPQQTEIVRVIKAAFMNSLQNYEQGNPRVWTVTGTPSS